MSLLVKVNSFGVIFTYVYFLNDFETAVDNNVKSLRLFPFGIDGITSVESHGLKVIPQVT